MIIIVNQDLEIFIYGSPFIRSMAKTRDILAYLKKQPVFTPKVVEDYIQKSRKYTNLFLHRLHEQNLIYSIEKGKYTLYNDPFLIASRIIWPSYISCWSALNYHKITEQVPQTITVLTTRSRQGIIFQGVEIHFVKIKAPSFFGYEKYIYRDFEIFVANIEKAIIDAALLHQISFAEVMEMVRRNRKEIDIPKLLKYIIAIGNKSLIKRFGYCFDLLGNDYYYDLKKYVDSTFVPLDYAKKKQGKKNTKWRLIINVEERGD